MPWCPKCKQEYVEGIMTCADCKTDLVENLTEDVERFIFLETTTEELAKKFIQFLEYSKIPDVTCYFKDEENTWIIEINADNKKQVEKLYKAFYNIEADLALSAQSSTSSEASSINKDEQTEDTIDEEECEDEKEFSSIFDDGELQDIIDNRKPKATVSPAYVKKEDQYKDLKSSADTFLIVSLLGIVILLLNVFGVIRIFAGAISYVVMGGMFAAFLFIAFTTYKKAKQVKTQIKDENDTTKAIQEWLSSNVTLDYLNSAVNQTDSNEVQFFQKIEKIKELVEHNFGELNDAYLDQLAEEFYNTHLDTSEA